MMEEQKIIDNPAHHRFEMDLGDDMAFIEYTHFKGGIVIMHTYVPESHRGQGIASRMIRQALEYIKAHNIPLIVYCPAVNKYIDSHPEYKVLLDEKYSRE